MEWSSFIKAFTNINTEQPFKTINPSKPRGYSNLNGLCCREKTKIIMKLKQNKNINYISIFMFQNYTLVKKLDGSLGIQWCFYIIFLLTECRIIRTDVVSCSFKHFNDNLLTFYSNHNTKLMYSTTIGLPNKKLWFFLHLCQLSVDTSILCNWREAVCMEFLFIFLWVRARP